MSDRTPEQIAREYVELDSLVIAPDTRRLAEAFLAARRKGIEEARRTFVELSNVPLGAAFHGGPLAGASIHNVAMWAVQKIDQSAGVGDVDKGDDGE